MTEATVTAPAILFVDDEATAIKYFERAIGSLAPVATAGSVEEGKRVLDRHADSLLVLVSDQRMPGAYGNELLTYARERYPEVVRILTTAYSELEHTVEAVNQGQIHRYIQKPWEISSLRMELKQALDLARLRQEHAALMRDKLTVRQRQTAGQRIAAWYALCAGLLEDEQPVPVEAYLRGAELAGVQVHEESWLLLDFADLEAAEADRNAGLVRSVREQLAALEQRAPGAAPTAIGELLAQGPCSAALQPTADGCVIVDPRLLAEHLEGSTGRPASAAHAGWIAGLLWLTRRGATLEMYNRENVIGGRLVQAPAATDAAQLAAWIEKF
ncbi:response regulator [Massilia arenosa]|uniref:Response regulator n=1 Tax=Zemynaea arenosa TaxID=2561931 RepID=A0A4Y9S6M4_9BURK|nr:response regulator [Massilia arenosa]TFW16168.1 response regulator [Massilia arenosa]